MVTVTVRGNDPTHASTSMLPSNPLCTSAAKGREPVTSPPMMGAEDLPADRSPIQYSTTNSTPSIHSGVILSSKPLKPESIQNTVALML